MKIPSSPDENSPSRQEALQAEAIEETRRRVREREGRAQAEAQLETARQESERRRQRRSPWEFSPDSTTGFWFEMFGPQLMLGVGLLALSLLLSAVLWMMTNLRLPIYLAIRSLDFATGAQALRGAPWLMWTLWGAIFGGALGYWLVAPQFGHRENRAFILLLPLLAMALSSALLWAFAR